MAGTVGMFVLTFMAILSLARGKRCLASFVIKFMERVRVSNKLPSNSKNVLYPLGWVDIGTRARVPLRFVVYL
jgi:hypothetical protein